MRALIVLTLVAIIAIAYVAVVWIQSRVKGARESQRELARHRQLVAELHQLAIDQLGVDPTAQLLELKIRKFHTAPSTRKEARS
ncbi:hypothetical protein [Nonomuraea endophytica]|uniref:Uncharacterized protein n=1 Tax=Nonomuraea endophytica TaxID=714136 RepID=A0A7W8EJA3_9ACTN|nr:hypothetical protein [Nonomuraea endophytica]MBB5081326.1 hypothetical protein [Nonomuraea endophytica]